MKLQPPVFDRPSLHMGDPEGFQEQGPTYAELYAEGCFAQRPLISSGDLRKLAIARGIDLRLSARQVLEPLDLIDAFSPIAFRQTNFSGETTWLRPDPSDFAWREEHQPRSWSTHAWQPPWRGDPGIVSECYSPWQILYLHRAFAELKVSIDASQVRETALFDQQRSMVELRAQGNLDRLRRLDERWRPLVKLLVALQPRFWPYRSGRTTLLSDDSFNPPRRVDPLKRAHETFDAGDLLERFGLTLDAVAWLHYDVASFAQRRDPAPHLYRLLTLTPRSRTDLLRGDALRARDLYDAAFLLRGFYYASTDQWLPLPDELDHAEEWDSRHLPRSDGSRTERSELKRLLIREGIYPHLIHFFVEGHTEKIVLDRLLPFLGFDLPGSGMSVTNIRGVDQAERHTTVFRSATEVATRTVLIADREGTLSKTLARLRDEGLFADDENVLLWERDGWSVDFEEANFSPREILNAIQTAARKRNRDLRLDLTVGEFRRERAKETRPKRPPPALSKLALKLAQDRDIRVSKPELAEVLAEKLVREIRRRGHLAEAGERRPLLANLWRWIANTRP
jgi:hypothetical protein